VSRRAKIIYSIKAMLILAVAIHWRFVAARLEAAGVPVALIPVAALVHMGLAVAIAVFAAHCRRSGSRGGE
jgi:hypothetical protein